VNVDLDAQGNPIRVSDDGIKDGQIVIRDDKGRIVDMFFDPSISPYEPGPFDKGMIQSSSSNFGQTGYVTSPQVGGYVSSPQVGGYVSSPQVGGYVGSPTIGATPVYYNTTRIYYDPNTGTYYTA